MSKTQESDGITTELVRYRKCEGEKKLSEYICIHVDRKSMEKISDA